ncbi:MAG: ATPase [Bacteroidales bacterium]|nr:ATPase [Bacteroidales bacterium]
MNKIAIPVIDGELSTHFGYTQQFHIYEINENIIVSEEIVTPKLQRPGLLPTLLANMGVTDIISRGMGERAMAQFYTHKINVFIGVPIKAPADLVSDFLNRTLETSDNTCCK